MKASAAPHDKCDPATVHNQPKEWKHDVSSSLEHASHSVNHLDDQVRRWREEQFLVASKVVVLPDDNGDNDVSVLPTAVTNTTTTATTGDEKKLNEKSSSGSRRYRILPPLHSETKLYGGVDVSFPQHEGDKAVAVYVIIQNFEMLYKDYETFHLTVPYIPSYLAFREIDPLERLVHRQMHNHPEFTPQAILVDGNGILHARRAGIACFLGIRTGLKTIGVGKTLYFQDGLTHELVKHGVQERVEGLWHQSRSDEMFHDSMSLLDTSKTGSRSLVVDRHCIHAKDDEEEELGHGKASLGLSDVPALDSSNENHDAPKNTIPSMKEMMHDLNPLCNGFAIKLVGKGGTTWGAALLGHGGKIGSSGAAGRNSMAGSKNPIFISVGHKTSWSEAVQVCAELSMARIPEPVRLADLIGRQIMREM